MQARLLIGVLLYFGMRRAAPQREIAKRFRVCGALQYHFFILPNWQFTFEILMIS